MTAQRKSTAAGKRQRRARARVYCAFAGCDLEATGHLGTVALCMLHERLLTGALDSGTAEPSRTGDRQTDVPQHWTSAGGTTP